MDVIVRLQHVSKSFGSQMVLKDVTLEVAKGSLLCINGSSGIGKTTLLDILAGAYVPDSGTREADSNRIGFAYQDDRLVPWLSVWDNLALAVGSYFSGSEKQDIVEFWLVAMDLLDCADKQPAQLSGGMKKRLNLARAFSVQPKLLFLDEPYAFQDDSNKSLITGLIKEIQRKHGTAVVLVAHGSDAFVMPDVTQIEVFESPVVLPN